MEERYRYREVLQSLYDRFGGLCDEAYTSSRPSVKETTKTFMVVRLSHGVRPYAQTHSTAYVQLQLYVRDRGNGIEDVPTMDSLVAGVRERMPFNTVLMSCNDTPVLLTPKSDGMGYHSVVMQFKVIIKI